jgi:hypothetical protein
MNGKELDYVRDSVEQEGFDYCFTGYSNFEEIKDEEFHKLREAFVKASNELKEYLGLEDL